MTPRRCPSPRVRARALRRAWRTLLAGAVCVAGTIACRGARGAEVVELRLWAMGREGEVLQQLMPDFERRHPGIRVRVQQVPWTAAHEKLLTSFVGESSPDVSQLGNTWIPEFAALGALEPLDARVGGAEPVAREDFFPGIWATNVLDGATYGVPWYVDTRVMFYRPDLLARAGYDAFPTTWAAWRDAMRRLKALGGATQWAILMPLDEWAQPTILAMQKSSSLLRDGGRYGAFTDSSFRSAFEFYVSMFHEGLAPTLANTQVANLYQDFAAGTFGMYITGPWNLGEFRNRLPADMQDRWATAPIPGPAGAESGVSIAGGSSLVIWQASRHKAEAWKLIRYLTEPEVQTRFYHLTGDLPSRASAWRDSTLARDARARTFFVQLQHVKPLPAVPEWELIATRLAAAAEAVARRRLTTDAALTGLQREVDGILEKRRWMLAQKARREAEGAPAP